MSYKPKDDLCIHKNCEIKVYSIELTNTEKSNIIIGAIYRHPNMDLDEFNDICLNPLLEKSPKANKSIVVLGGFNVDLLKHDHHASTNVFYFYVLTTHSTTS